MRVLDIQENVLEMLKKMGNGRCRVEGMAEEVNMALLILVQPVEKPP
ncbi:MAG: hypothetical protein NVSMB27_26200 [Ktedonobacteraceae bacterium]